MRYSLALIFLLVAVNVDNIRAQEKVADYHPIVLAVKNTSQYSARVDWEVVNKHFVERTAGKEGNELKEGLQFLVNGLGDKHASF